MRRLIQATLQSLEWRLLVPLAIGGRHPRCSCDRQLPNHPRAFPVARAQRGRPRQRPDPPGHTRRNAAQSIRRCSEDDRAPRRAGGCGDDPGLRQERVIILSAGRAEIGTQIPIDSDTCLSCHGDEETKDLALLEQSVITQSDKGPKVLRHLSVIENEPACSAAPCHFHPADQRVLGVLDVGLSMAPLQAAIGASQRAVHLDHGSARGDQRARVAVFVRRVIQQPTRELYRGTTYRRRRSGDTHQRRGITYSLVSRRRSTR
jgi:hypothetical protein